VLAVAGLLAATVAGTVHASSVTYYLNQTNIDQGTWIDGLGYLKVTIDNNDALHPNNINFTVATLSKLNNAASTNFGIQAFDFNTKLPNTDYSNVNFTNLPGGWSPAVAPPPNQADGFGAFDLEVSNGGSNRLSTLKFSITGVSGDTLSTYFDNSTGTAGQGNVPFAAHVADFTTGLTNSSGAVTSGWFGGGTTVVPPSDVPVPAAVWLFGSGLMGLVGIARRRRTS